MSVDGITKVYNADQTGCFFEYLPKKTVDCVGAPTVWVRCGGKDKERATAMLLADSDGVKHPLFLVFKSKSSSVPETCEENAVERHGWGEVNWSMIEPLQMLHNCQIYGNESAWWNADLSVAFLEFHFGQRHNMEEKILLVWDAFSAHWTDAVQAKAAELNVILMEVPASYSWCCQPADVGWNKPLKDGLRSRWISYLMKTLKNYDKSQPFQFTPPSHNTIIEWIADSFDDLSKTVITNGFRATKWLVPDDFPLPDPHDFNDPVLPELLGALKEL
ncbi:hypothetical protein ACHHYP_16359 [Achlya hypogyna]|uniref:DDE-1 domain-containing protein n=1 Tax=Achlya hypogyna TaxID=1202772 RepID=A0A1V9Y920_ACHHY|nr:hypothetical protein ACHHYP_16359 [Achlya hypogyna]